MNLEELIETILSEVDGFKAWNWVGRISQYNRVQASIGYHEVAQVLKRELEFYGYDNVDLYKSPADGKTTIWGSTSPYQWEIDSGELWIIEPAKKKLCDYNDMPLSIITHSKPCDIIAEIVEVGTITSMEDLSDDLVEGKIILTSSPLYFIREIIEESSAIGVIYYPDLERTGPDFDKIIYNGFFTNERRMKNCLIGFSIGYRQAMELKKMLEQAPVKVHARIDCKFQEGNLEVLTTAIKGTDFPEKELIIISHLCHPISSANDNASGSAGTLEIARVLKTLINKKIITPPKFSIRFAWVPEFYGTVPWAKQNESLIKKVLACINLDMIGEHGIKIGNPFLLISAPYSTPSILNDLLEFFLKVIADDPNGIAKNGTKIPMKYRITAFDGGSDHVIFADSYFGIPSMMIGHDDPYWHSSMDTVEFCDPTELKRVIGITACTMYLLSSFDQKCFDNVWPIIQSGINNRLNNAVKLVDTLLIAEQNSVHDNPQNEESFQFAYSLLKKISDHEIEVLNSINKYITNMRGDFLINHAKMDVNSWFEQKENYLKKVIEKYHEKEFSNNSELYSSRYIRNYRGVFPIDNLVKLSQIPQFKAFVEESKYKYLGIIHELINLIDKGYNILEVSSLLSLQYESIILPNKIDKLVNLLVEQNHFSKQH